MAASEVTVKDATVVASTAIAAVDRIEGHSPAVATPEMSAARAMTAIAAVDRVEGDSPAVATPEMPVTHAMSVSAGIETTTAVATATDTVAATTAAIAAMQQAHATATPEAVVPRATDMAVIPGPLATTAIAAAIVLAAKVATAGMTVVATAGMTVVATAGTVAATAISVGTTVPAVRMRIASALAGETTPMGAAAAMASSGVVSRAMVNVVVDTTATPAAVQFRSAMVSVAGWAGALMIAAIRAASTDRVTANVTTTARAKHPARGAADTTAAQKEAAATPVSRVAETIVDPTVGVTMTRATISGVAVAIAAAPSVAVTIAGAVNRRMAVDKTSSAAATINVAGTIVATIAARRVAILPSVAVIRVAIATAGSRSNVLPEAMIEVLVGMDGVTRSGLIRPLPILPGTIPSNAEALPATTVAGPSVRSARLTVPGRLVRVATMAATVLTVAAAAMVATGPAAASTAVASSTAAMRIGGSRIAATGGTAPDAATGHASSVASSSVASSSAEHARSIAATSPKFPRTSRCPCLIARRGSACAA
ncbi:hypothetical protein FB461_1082 [Rarobacter faecitabidus]|uniref:Uncharacterized protein n=1 Tax=Rarobacter faecitabidus TaxID=13243 RepID=A0A542ZWF7_RARFA|nr:hypothetical protein FB461_1082 [Rarobacter faecitabidus]